VWFKYYEGGGREGEGKLSNLKRERNGKFYFPGSGVKGRAGHAVRIGNTKKEKKSI